MKKKFIACALVISLSLVNTSMVFAQSENFVEENTIRSNVNVVSAPKAFSEKQISELENIASASYVSEDGTMIPLDVSLEIEEVVNEKARSVGAEQKTYLIKASTQKTESKAGDANWKEGVTASAYAEMLWTDVSGSKNTIDKITGSVTVTKGTLTGSFIKWGDTHVQEKDTNKVSGGKDVKSLTARPNYTSTSFKGSVHGCYVVKFKERVDDYIMIVLNPSMMD